MTSEVFIPTYLYIKQHSVTGKLYFGKTIRNPEKYYGSGTRWLRHINKHGKEHVVNLWYELFTDREELTNFALHFSQKMNIVESSQWLNLIPENGINGGGFGRPCGNFSHSSETKDKISKSLIGHQSTRKPVGQNPLLSEIQKEMISKKLKGRKRSPESIAKQISSSTGKIRGKYKPRLISATF